MLIYKLLGLLNLFENKAQRLVIYTSVLYPCLVSIGQVVLLLRIGVVVERLNQDLLQRGRFLHFGDYDFWRVLSVEVLKLALKSTVFVRSVISHILCSTFLIQALIQFWCGVVQGSERIQIQAKCMTDRSVSRERGQVQIQCQTALAVVDHLMRFLIQVFAYSSLIL